MIAKKLIRDIQKIKGPIYVETSNFNDVFWVQVVKTDLINMIKDKFDDDFETEFTLDYHPGGAYFAKDYGVE
jgi:hypothetical protein